jgi:hypothetical protein
MCLQYQSEYLPLDRLYPRKPSYLTCAEHSFPNLEAFSSPWNDDEDGDDDGTVAATPQPAPSPICLESTGLGTSARDLLEQNFFDQLSTLQVTSVDGSAHSAHLDEEDNISVENTKFVEQLKPLHRALCTALKASDRTSVLSIAAPDDEKNRFNGRGYEQTSMSPTLHDGHEDDNRTGRLIMPVQAKVSRWLLEKRRGDSWQCIHTSRAFKLHSS